MTFQQMFMVMTLAVEGSFSKAAEACYISQSSFSKNIQNVEEELGVRLFVRDKNGVYPTPEGRVFLQYAEMMLQSYQEVRARFNRRRSGKEVLSMGLLNVCNIQRVLPLLTGYQKDHPEVQLSIQELDWQHLSKKMKEGEFDVVFSWRETLPGGLTQTVIYEDRVVLMTSRDHPLAARTEPVSIAEIAQETFILASPSASMKINDKLFYTAGFRPAKVHMAGHPVSMLHMVKEGLGVAIIAYSTYEYLRSLVGADVIRCLNLREEYRFQYTACFLDPSNPETAHLMAYLDLCLGREAES